MQNRTRDLDRYWKTIHCPTHRGYYRSHISDCEICRNIHRLQSQVGTARAKLRVIERLGGKCRRCGITDPRVLTVNHVGSHRKGRRAGKELYFGITSGKLSTHGLELLCFNCNALHEYQRGNRLGLRIYRDLKSGV